MSDSMEFPSDIDIQQDKAARHSRWWLPAGAMIALGYVLLLLATADPIGYAKDEGYYFSASRTNYGWFKNLKDNLLAGTPANSFSDSTIRRYWDNNHEHPSMCKIMQGFNNVLWEKTLGVMNPGTSFRMSTMIQAGLAMFLIFLLGLRFFGPGAAVFAPLMFGFMPRVFFHAHLNTYDMPNVFFWLLTVTLFWKGLTRPAYLVWSGIVWGLAMSARNAAFFLPVVMFLIYLRSPLMKEFLASFTRIPKGIRAFGLKRWLIAAVWTGILAFSAFLQFHPDFRATASGLIIMQLLAFVLPLFFGITALIGTMHHNDKPLRHTLPGWILLLAAMGMIGIAMAYGNVETPFNVLVLTIWLYFAGYLCWYYFRHGVSMPAWARPIVAPVVLGPLTFFLVWPWLYHDTWSRLGAFLARHLDPPAWQTMYFGDMITNPPPYPSSYPFVMWFFTIPMLFLFLAALGTVLIIIRGRTSRRELKRTIMGSGLSTDSKMILWKKSAFARGWLLLVCVAIPPLVIALPSTPVYGGTKHFLHALPFMALIASVAFLWLGKQLLGLLPRTLSPKIQQGILAVFGLLLLMPGIYGTASGYRYGLGYYNEIMGGIIAAPEVGMQQSFWSYQTRAILPWLNEHVPQNGSVAWNNLPWDCFDMYKQEGKLRKDIRMAPNTDLADFYVTTVWQMFLDGTFDVETAYGANGIVAQDDIFGLPMVIVHQNMKRIPKPIKTPWE